MTTTVTADVAGLPELVRGSPLPVIADTLISEVLRICEGRTALSADAPVEIMDR